MSRSVMSRQQMMMDGEVAAPRNRGFIVHHDGRSRAGMAASRNLWVTRFVIITITHQEARAAEGARRPFTMQSKAGGFLLGNSAGTDADNVCPSGKIAHSHAFEKRTDVSEVTAGPRDTSNFERLSITVQTMLDAVDFVVHRTNAVGTCSLETFNELCGRGEDEYLPYPPNKPGFEAARRHREILTSDSRRNPDSRRTPAMRSFPKS